MQESTSRHQPMSDFDQQRQEQKDMRAQAKPAQETKSQTYVVKAGDSLSKIAKEVYGDAARWPEIYEANKATIKDPNVIVVGQELKIP